MLRQVHESTNWEDNMAEEKPRRLYCPLLTELCDGDACAWWVKTTSWKHTEDGCTVPTESGYCVIRDLSVIADGIANLEMVDICRGENDDDSGV